jgi:hypothetical protein
MPNGFRGSLPRSAIPLAVAVRALINEDNFRDFWWNATAFLLGGVGPPQLLTC